MATEALIPVELKKILPTRAGCAVFIGNDEKVFVFYVDPFVGSAIAMQLGNAKRDRPQTHDLLAIVLQAVGAELTRVVINDFRDGVFFARLFLRVSNEVQKEKLFIELDARPSDSVVLALRAKCPIFVAEDVWTEMEDMREVLAKLEENDEDEDQTWV